LGLIWVLLEIQPLEKNEYLGARFEGERKLGPAGPKHKKYSEEWSEWPMTRSLSRNTFRVEKKGKKQPFKQKGLLRIRRSP